MKSSFAEWRSKSRSRHAGGDGGGVEVRRVDVRAGRLDVVTVATVGGDAVLLASGCSAK